MKTLSLHNLKKVVGGIGGGDGDDGNPKRLQSQTFSSGGGTEPIFESKRK